MHALDRRGNCNLGLFYLFSVDAEMCFDSNHEAAPEVEPRQLCSFLGPATYLEPTRGSAGGHTGRSAPGSALARGVHICLNSHQAGTSVTL